MEVDLLVPRPTGDLLRDPHSDQSGLTPPPVPAFSSLFKTQLRKHLFLAWKRKRWISAIWSSLLWGGITVVLYFTLRQNLTDPDSSSYIVKIIAATLYPVFIGLAINSAFSTGYVEIITEKESKMKVVQNVYGLTDANYWLAWLTFFVLLSLPCVAILFVSSYVVTPIFRSVNVAVLLVMYLLAFVQQFLIVAVGSIFFKTVKGAQTVMNLVSVLLVEGSSALMLKLQGQALWVQLLAGVVPVLNIVQSFNSLGMASAVMRCTGANDNRRCQDGIGLGNMFTTSGGCLTPYDDDPKLSPEQNCLRGGGYYQEFLPPGICLVMMILATALFFFFAWWLDSIWQGEFGSAKPLCFCLNPLYVCPKRQSMRDFADPETGDHTVAISIQGLHKKFKDKVAVNDLNLQVYSGEIFAMLGHNGAGKTTAINCLVGIIPVTSGGARVNGFDIRTDMDAARRQMSICPQDNPMYAEFTVRQHLVYFSSLRGVPECRVRERIATILSALGLSEKVDDLCRTLSGGQKRRLWVATALVGESPIVFLDEPTSGMDPASRRELWDLLIQMKLSGRCVMFTTHYLEEADLLADRKCVLALGTVQAVGTSRELKHQFGVGYRLVVEMRGSQARDAEVEQLVLRHVARASKENVDAVEQAQAADQAMVHVERFTLPYSEMDLCGPLFVELENSKDVLGVRDYTLETSSLEDVFMALGRRAEASRPDGSVNVDFGEVERDHPVAGDYRSERSPLRNILALVRLKFSWFRNNRRLACYMTLLPCVFLLLSLWLPESGGNNSYAMATYPPLAFGIACLGTVRDTIRDREKKTKYVMLAQGVRSKDYWVGTICAGSIGLFFISLVFCVLYLIFPPHGVGDGATVLVFIMALINPINLLLFSVNVGALFQSEETAMKLLPLLFMLGGLIPTMVVWALITFGDVQFIGNLLHCIFSIINPLYSFGGVLVYVTQRSQESWRLGPWTLPGVFESWVAVPLYAAPVLFLALSFNLVRMDIGSYTTKPGDYRDFGDVKKDDDVMDEQRRIENDPNPVHVEAARYQGLSHTYRTKVQGKWKETHAVRGISLGIQAGECFGLLGPNGAGKTTTLAVLTGDVRPPTAGRVTIYGHDMSTAAGTTEAYRLLGVCPQVDPIIDDIPGRDHLLFFGRIKGVPEADLAATVDTLLQRLGLSSAATQKAGTYSGGMKRKLSVGIALIGHMPMLFLDEPSAAVDAGAKRHLWKVIKNRASDQTVVLTTHSMEEAEALCDRLAIQVKGQLRCLGTPMHLRNRYGYGYQLEIFAAPPGHDALAKDPSLTVTDFVLGCVSSASRLLEHHGDRYLFQLPALGDDLTLGRVLTQITANKAVVGISDWSIERPTLEQVFLRFAQEQEESMDHE